MDKIPLGHNHSKQSASHLSETAFVEIVGLDFVVTNSKQTGYYCGGVFVCGGVRQDLCNKKACS